MASLGSNSLASDQALAPPAIDRFRARFGTFCRVVGVAILSVAAVIFAASGNGVVFLATLFSSLLLIAAPRWEKDVCWLFLLVHPGIFYVATTLALAVVNWNFGLRGLLDPTKAFLIVFVYQMMILAAYLAAKLLALSQAVSYNRPNLRDASPLLLAGVACLAFFAGRLLNVGALGALTPILLAIFYLGTSACIVNHPERAPTVTLASVFVMLIISVILNERTPLFISIIFMITFLIAHTRKLFTLKNFIAFITILIAVNWITYSVISARRDGDMGLTNDVVGRTFDVFFSVEGIRNAVPLLADKSIDLTFSQRQNRYFSPFLSGSENITQHDSIFARFALIAYMDIVVGRVGDVSDIDWEKILSLVVSVLPDVGQQKNLIYSDEVAWDLGLRSRSTVGRPLITVPGEIYVIGGYGALIVVFFAYLLIFLELSLLRRLVGYNLIYVATALTVVYGITMTGTALALLSTSIRTLPVVLIVSFILVNFGRRAKERHEIVPPGSAV